MWPSAICLRVNRASHDLSFIVGCRDSSISYPMLHIYFVVGKSLYFVFPRDDRPIELTTGSQNTICGKIWNVFTFHKTRYSNKLSFGPSCFDEMVSTKSWDLVPTHPTEEPGCGLSAGGWEPSPCQAVCLAGVLHSCVEGDEDGWGGWAWVQQLNVSDFLKGQPVQTQPCLPAHLPQALWCQKGGRDLASTPTALDQRPGSGKTNSPWGDDDCLGGHHGSSCPAPKSVFIAQSRLWSPMIPVWPPLYQIPTAHLPLRTLPWWPMPCSP